MVNTSRRKEHIKGLVIPLDAGTLLGFVMIESQSVERAYGILQMSIRVSGIWLCARVRVHARVFGTGENDHIAHCGVQKYISCNSAKPIFVADYMFELVELFL